MCLSSVWSFLQSIKVCDHSYSGIGWRSVHIVWRWIAGGLSWAWTYVNNKGDKSREFSLSVSLTQTHTTDSLLIMIIDFLKGHYGLTLIEKCNDLYVVLSNSTQLWWEVLTVTIQFSQFSHQCTDQVQLCITLLGN